MARSGVACAIGGARLPRARPAVLNHLHSALGHVRSLELPDLESEMEPGKFTDLAMLLRNFTVGERLSETPEQAKLLVDACAARGMFSCVVANNSGRTAEG